MYFISNIEKSIAYTLSGIVPSSVSVAIGYDYSTMLQQTPPQVPTIVVSLADVESAAFELGSDATRAYFTVEIHAASKIQRDALKQIIYSGLTSNVVIIYQYSGLVSPLYSVRQSLVEHITVQDTPLFDQNRERFFWTAVVTADITVLGIGD